MQGYHDADKNVIIRANKLNIGEDVSFGNNIDIECKGKFEIGDHSRLGDNCYIRGRNVIFGKHLFNSGGMRIGGGGRLNPTANFVMGDRCTNHTCFINIDQPVIIGNDVGLSPEVTILTHGSWLSVLDGYPVSFASVELGNKVWLGYRVVVNPGVRISSEIIVGTNSLVVKDLKTIGIYGGVPARFMRGIQLPTFEEKALILKDIVDEYAKVIEYHGVAIETVHLDSDYPKIRFNDVVIDVEECTIKGEENAYTDDFRDYLRRNSIKIYTDRPFKSCFKDGE